jgi:hypothetical protein
MMRIAYLSLFAVFNTLICAQDVPTGIVMPDLDTIEASRTQKHMTPEQKVEAFEAYYIENAFSEAFANRATSMLTEDEQKEFGFGMDTSFQDDLVKKELIKTLAKQDILKLKPLLLKHQKRASENYGQSTKSID